MYTPKSVKGKTNIALDLKLKRTYLLHICICAESDSYFDFIGTDCSKSISAVSMQNLRLPTAGCHWEMCKRFSVVPFPRSWNIFLWKVQRSSSTILWFHSSGAPLSSKAIPKLSQSDIKVIQVLPWAPKWSQICLKVIPKIHQSYPGAPHLCGGSLELHQIYDSPVTPSPSAQFSLPQVSSIMIRPTVFLFAFASQSNAVFLILG